jgi:hypothetical protein|tara:strand:+ start:354 stop:491 length:138 start_codon:yes stop_codon:yes gene_type:complete
VTLSLLELRFPVIADIIMADGSPLENIDKPLNVGFVMKGAKVYKD